MPASYNYNNGYFYNTSTGTNTNYYTALNWNQATTTYYPLTQTNIVYPSFTPALTPTLTQANYADQIWQQWNNQVNQITYGSHQPSEAYAAQEKERSAARVRARVLLGEFLSDEQKAELEHHGRFHVTGSKGRRYCIRAEGQAGNVDLLKPDGGIQARLCCHPRDYLPDGDAWLMQMIELQHDEDHFLATANVHRGALPAAA